MLKIGSGRYGNSTSQKSCALALWLGGASLTPFSIVRWPSCASVSAHFIP